MHHQDRPQHGGDGFHDPAQLPTKKGFFGGESLPAQGQAHRHALRQVLQANAYGQHPGAHSGGAFQAIGQRPKGHADGQPFRDIV